MSEVEKCRNGHSGVGLYHTTPKGQRYCRECHTIRAGARRAATGEVFDSKYAGVYEAGVLETIARLEKKKARIEQQIARHRERLG